MAWTSGAIPVKEPQKPILQVALSKRTFKLPVLNLQPIKQASQIYVGLYHFRSLQKLHRYLKLISAAYHRRFEA